VHIKNKMMISLLREHRINYLYKWMDERGVHRILGIILVLTILSMSAMAVRGDANDNDLSFRQKLTLPQLTDDMHNQPVDVAVNFVHSCWAVGETVHSVRIMYNDESAEIELECQIYNLKHIDDAHISSCNIVFLLQGNGDYFVYYNDVEVAAPDYPDHVAVDDCSYYYEPIPGYSIDLGYYRISEEDDILYGVGQQGSFFGIDMSQKVIKQLPGKQDFRAANWGQLASFALFWYEGQDKGTDEKLISKDILVDGNLMVRVGVKSRSSDDKMETTAFYTYYYSPQQDKRLTVEVTHEALEAGRIYGMEEEDGIYAYLLTVQSRSASFPDLNLGYIPPFLHVNTEDGVVYEYLLDQDPENEEYNWLLSTKDDIDLGSPAWFSIDDGAVGRAYALMFNDTSIASELDGIQVKATTRQEVNVPGLEVDGGGISAGRNAFEAGGSHDRDIPKGFTVRFIAEFYATPSGGLSAVEREAAVFNKLVPYRKGPLGAVEGSIAQTHRLIVYPHFASAVPFASALSALTGLGLPPTSVELWRNDTFVSSGVAGRFPISMADDQLNIDWSNVSVRKRVVFPNVPPGSYVVKVRNGLAQRYVGATVVEVRENTSVRVWCRWQGMVSLTINDENGDGIAGVIVRAERDGHIFATNVTNDVGVTQLVVPAPAGYTITARYKGFAVMQKSLGLIFRHQDVIMQELHDLEVVVEDLLGMPPGVLITPVLRSTAVTENKALLGVDEGGGYYRFFDLPPDRYTLQIRYKSFIVTEAVQLSGNDRIELTFPAAYTLNIVTRNARGGLLSGRNILIARNGEDITSKQLPPGVYEIRIRRDNNIIGERTIMLTEDRDIIMVTSHQPLFPLLVTLLALGSAGIGGWCFRRRFSLPEGALLLAIVLLVISLVQPWWALEGDSASLDVTSRVFLIPANMVTMGKGLGVENGEVASMPSLFTTMLVAVGMLSVFSIAASVAVLMMRRVWLYLVSVGTLGGALVVFSAGMGTAAEIITGTFWGSGTIDLSVPGSATVSMVSTWSPSTGYYLVLAAFLLVISSLLMHLDVLPKRLKRQ